MVIADPYDTTVTGSLGVEYVQKIITANDEYDLRDTARGSANYNAPGDDRLVVDGFVRFVKEGDDKAENFVTIAEFVDGEINAEKTGAIYSEIGRELARRTRDESGDYTVEPFEATFQEHAGAKIKNATVLTGGISHRVSYETTTPHNFLPDENITVSGVEGVAAESYNGDFVVDTVLNETSFEVSLDNIPDADPEGTGIVAKSKSKMSSKMTSGCIGCHNVFRD